MIRWSAWLWSGPASIRWPTAFQAAALPTELPDPHKILSLRERISGGPDGIWTRDLRLDRAACTPNCTTGPYYQQMLLVVCSPIRWYVGSIEPVVTLRHGKAYTNLWSYEEYFFVPRTGFEPVLPAWKAGVLGRWTNGAGLPKGGFSHDTKGMSRSDQNWLITKIFYIFSWSTSIMELNIWPKIWKRIQMS